MSTTQQTETELAPPKLSLTISGDRGVGKSTLAQYLSGLLRLHGHDVVIIEKYEGEKLMVAPMPDLARQFQAKRAIRIEVKEAK